MKTLDEKFKKVVETIRTLLAIILLLFAYVEIIDWMSEHNVILLKLVGLFAISCCIVLIFSIIYFSFICKEGKKTEIKKD